MTLQKQIALWLYGAVDVVGIDLHEAFVIRQIRHHQRENKDVLVVVYADDKQEYSSHWTATTDENKLPAELKI